MIIGLFKDAVGWLVSLTEAGLAIAAMLLIALLVAMTGFWLLGHFLSKLGGAPAELDPYDDEAEDMTGAKVVSIRPDEDSPPSKLGA